MNGFPAAPRLEEWVLGMGCCSCSCDNHAQELQVSLSTDMHDGRGGMRHPVPSQDGFEPHLTPRAPFTARQSPITPRQLGLRDTLQLPVLSTYPVPPGCEPHEDEDERQRILLDMYQQFALELYTGMYLTQLTSNRDYSDIHCQLMEDMQTLKLDQSNGRIIEFPLTGVSKVYRIVKSDDKWYSATSPVPPDVFNNSEHIVVVEFMRRKLAFVFKDVLVSQRFLICMELLIRRAQQKQAKKARSLAKVAVNTPLRLKERDTSPKEDDDDILRSRGVAALD